MPCMMNSAAGGGSPALFVSAHQLAGLDCSQARRKASCHELLLLGIEPLIWTFLEPFKALSRGGEFQSQLSALLGRIPFGIIRA